MSDFETPEDNVKIIVGKRRSGKTTKLLNDALDKLDDNRDVIFVTDRKNQGKYIYQVFLGMIDCRTFDKNDTYLQVRMYKGGIIRFLSMDFFQTLTEEELPKNSFKIYDGIIVKDFDMVSINGEIVD